MKSMEGLHPVTLLAEKKFTCAWMELFLEREAEYFEKTCFNPCAFEIEFGLTGKGNKTQFPALRLESENESVLISGRIDRIDMEEQNDKRYIRVIDYKTGNVETKLKKLSEGSDLQIPIYLEAATKTMFPGSFIHDGVYYSLRDMEFKEYKKTRVHPLTGSDWENYIVNAASRAVSVISKIRKGYFPLPESVCDTYCEFIHLCRGGRSLPEEE